MWHWYAVHKLPPTLNALVLHLGRVPLRSLPSPVNNGKVEIEGQLEAEFTILEEIPEIIVWSGGGGNICRHSNLL